MAKRLLLVMTAVLGLGGCTRDDCTHDCGAPCVVCNFWDSVEDCETFGRRGICLDRPPCPQGAICEPRVACVDRDRLSCETP